MLIPARLIRALDPCDSGAEAKEMSKQTIQIYRWIFKCDPEATQRAYMKVPTGCAEECGCDTCQNFLAARNYAYPLEGLALFSRLGIAYNREAESYHNARLDSGLHSYGGWFHFIGSIEKGDDLAKATDTIAFQNSFEKIAEHFSVGFTSNAVLIPKSFEGNTVVQLEFQTEIPWLIDKPEER